MGRPGGGAIPPKLATRASPQGGGAALGRPGGGVIPPKLAARASPRGAAPRRVGAAPEGPPRGCGQPPPSGGGARRARSALAWGRSCNGGRRPHQPAAAPRAEAAGAAAPVRLVRRPARDPGALGRGTRPHGLRREGRGPERAKHAPEDRDREARRADQGDRQAARPDPAGARPQAGGREPPGESQRGRPSARPDRAPAARRHLSQIAETVRDARPDGRIRTVERARLDADAQRRGVALDRDAGARRDQARDAARRDARRARPAGQRVHVELPGEACLAGIASAPAAAKPGAPAPAKAAASGAKA